MSGIVVRGADTEKREKLLAAAIELFARDGINGTSTAAVARAAGVAAGTLFNYFATKEELIRSAYLVCKRGVAARMAEDYSPEHSFDKTMEKVWRGAVAYSLENLNHHDFMKEYKNRPESRDPQIHQELQSDFGFIDDTVAAGVARGEMADIPHDFLHLVFGSFFEATLDYIRDRDPAEHEAVIKLSYGLLRRALRP